MNVTDDHVSAAVLLTGFTPEYIGDVLGKRELSNAEFFDELEKRGYDLAEFFVSGDEFNIRWKQREQECMQYQNELLAKAQKVFDAMHSLPILSLDGEEVEYQQYLTTLGNAIKDNLDASSIFQFVDLAVGRAASLRSVHAAAKRHTENRAMKVDVFAWCDDKMINFKSMDSAAESIAGKLVPATFRTVRDWIGEWKKLRSASTP